VRPRFILWLLVAAAVGSASLFAQEAARRRGLSIEITEPANQGIVFGKTKIAATVKVADPSVIDRVEFLVGDQVIFVDREPPYECTHNFGEESKSFIVQAVAYHVEEVSVRDAVVTRRIGFTTVERVNRVILWISATDKQDHFVTDLAQEDFRIFENDVEQKVLDFYREDRPITMAFLLDSSGSMREKLKEVHEAASSFVETLRPEDRALVIDFDEKVFLVQDLTADQEKLKEAITSTEAIGGTSIYDALHAAYRKIGNVEGRKVIVLLTDGEDSSSQFSYKRVLEEAKLNATMIFAIALGGEGSVDKSVPKSFSEMTGGRFFFVNKAADLAGVYQRIAEELRTQYYLAYSTTNEEWDGRWMKVRVEDERPGIKVRARRGYFAVRSVD
jgi:Ca-activated chloride channel family protein